MKALNIKWETDGYDVELPNEVQIPNGISEDEVTDYLSDTFGWLINSYELEFDADDEYTDHFGGFVNEVEAKVS